MSRVLSRLRHEERGSVLVVVAGFLPIAVLLAAWVIDLGNGAEHRRQLQLQADAGALAAAKEFDRCATNPAAANADMYEIAEDYATVRNIQVGGERAGDVGIVLNDGAPVDGTGAPCDVGWIDVKLTEEDSPAFFGFVGSHDWRAHARVQALRVTRLAGMLPLGVPSPEPRTAWAMFFNEASPSTSLATVELKSTSFDDDLNLSLWETENPASVPISSPHVGVRIAFSGGTTAPTNCDPPVTCFQNGTEGLVHIQGASTATAPQQNAQGITGRPVVRGVSIQPVDSSESPCVDPRFLPSFSPGVPTCPVANRRVAITATVDFGGNPANANGKLRARVNNVFTPQVTPDSNGVARWVVSIPSAAAGGAVPIDIEWSATKGQLSNANKDKCSTNNNNNPCEEVVEDLQRHFRTSTLSGPIDLMQVTNASGDTDANSFAQGTTASLNVKIGIAGTLQADGPLQTLRLGGVNRTGGLDCDPNIPNFKGELGNPLGCPEYAVNEGTACPDNTPPLECVPVETGNATNQTPSGLNERILGQEKPNSCPPLGAPGHNNYSLVQAGTPVEGDKRFVVLFLTRFGALDGMGQGQVPITGFARFYITGWNGSGGGFNNPCQGDGDDPAGSGEIVGYFLNYVKTPNEGGSSTDPCDFDSIRPCTPVLVD